MSSPSGGPGTPDAGPKSRQRLLDGRMLGLASGAILVPLNSTMLAVALPSIMTEFGVDAATVASLVTVYLGAVAIALPASGTLGDRFGHRRVFLVGVVAFAAASMLAAIAPAFSILALSRVLQARQRRARLDELGGPRFGRWPPPTGAARRSACSTCSSRRARRSDR